MVRRVNIFSDGLAEMDNDDSDNDTDSDNDSEMSEEGGGWYQGAVHIPTSRFWRQRREGLQVRKYIIIGKGEHTHRDRKLYRSD